MSTADGTVLGTAKIADHGPATRRWNLLMLSEGYRSAEMAQFANDAQQFAQTLFSTPPFDRLQTASNVHPVDVTSTESGAADPTACQQHCSESKAEKRAFPQHRQRRPPVA